MGVLLQIFFSLCSTLALGKKITKDHSALKKRDDNLADMWPDYYALYVLEYIIYKLCMYIVLTLHIQ